MADNKKTWAVFVVLLSLAALLVAGKFPYMFFYLALLSCLIPYWRLRVSLKQLKGEVTVSPRVREVGESFSVSYKIINSDSGSFPYLEVPAISGSLSQHSRFLSLEAGEIREISTEIYCGRRGVYKLDSLTVKTGDPFGFFRLTKRLADGGEVKVYPRLRSFPGLDLPVYRQAGEQAAKNTVFEDRSRFAGLREWQDGDSIKQIHWKQSAKQEKIIVRKFESAAEAGLILFLDMFAESYRHDSGHLLEDLAVELAASLAYSRLKANLPVTLYSCGLENSPLGGSRIRDYAKIADQLITLAPEREGSFYSYLQQQSFYLQPDASLYLLSPSLSLAGADVLLSLKSKGFSLVLLQLCLQKITGKEEEIHARLRGKGVKTHILAADEGVVRA